MCGGGTSCVLVVAKAVNHIPMLFGWHRDAMLAVFSHSTAMPNMFALTNLCTTCAFAQETWQYAMERGYQVEVTIETGAVSYTFHDVPNAEVGHISWGRATTLAFARLHHSINCMPTPTDRIAIHFLGFLIVGCHVACRQDTSNPHPLPFAVLLPHSCST